MDAQYTPEEYPQKVGWGHSTSMDALRLAQEANVKHLVLFHHDPSRSDHALDTIVTLCNAWSAKQHCDFTCLGAAEGGQIHV
jgi:ribonuclease BN (tRNA processing enzyme)